MNDECVTPEEIQEEIDACQEKIRTLEDRLQKDFHERFELKQKEKVLASVFKVTQVGICITDEKGRFVEVNDAYCRIYGYARSEIIGNPFTLVLEEQYWDNAQKMHDDFIAGNPEIPIEWVVRRKDGTALFVVVTAGLLIDDEGKRFKVTTVTDITQQKKSAELINRFGRILEQTYDEIYIFDSQSFKLIQLNQGALNNTGYPAETLLDSPFYTLFAHLTPQQFERLISPLQNNEREILVFESVFTRYDGSEYNCEVRLQLMVHEKPPVYVAIVQDTTERNKLLRMEQELNLAREIQYNLMPHSNPDIEGYDIAGSTVPSKEVGGDYYDFLHMAEGDFVFCLGDISGKGMPAALLMSNLQATVRGQTLLERSPQDCLYYANKLLYFNTPSNRFATFFLGHLDVTTHTLIYANAGHIPPLLVDSQGEITQLKDGEIVLGVLQEHRYQQEKFYVPEQSTLILFSDGVTEAMSKDGEEYGEERLNRVVRKYASTDAASLIREIVSDIEKHTETLNLSDDMTIVVVKRR